MAGWQAYSGVLDSFLGQVFRGIQAAAQEHKCNLLIACGVGSARGTGLGRPAWPFFSPEVDFIPVGPWNTNGLIVIPPFAASEGKDFVKGLIERGFPLVFAGDRDTGPAVIIDNFGGIYQALTHLQEHGHRRIAFIAGREHHVHGDSGIRLRAYLSCVQELGLECDPALVRHGFHTYLGGRQAVERLLHQRVTFTAVLASNDESALGAMQALHEAGRLVPQDVAVIGFDDRIEARAQIPSLTTIHYPMFELGYLAVGLLTKAIEGIMEPEEIVRIPARLVVRESCGCSPDQLPFFSTPQSRLQTADGQYIDRDEVGLPFLAQHAIGDLLTLPSQKSVEEVVAAMAAAVYNESQQLSQQESAYLCCRLVDAFIASLEQGDPTTFRLALRQILERVSSLGEDLFAWQEALSILRQGIPFLVSSCPISLDIQGVEDYLHQARLVISEVSRGQSSRLSVRLSNSAEQLGQMTASFFAAQNETDLFSSLARSLPAFGIQQAAVAFYEKEAEDPVAWSILHAPASNLSGGMRFPTRQFPPPGLYPPERPFNLVILPLQEEDVYGFVAFEFGALEPCAIIVRQLSAALRGIRLYREAVHAKLIAEEANRLKSRFLSMVSHELRTPLNLITGLSNLLLQQSSLVSPEQCLVNRQDLERIYVGSQHLDSLIRDVLDLARSHMGQLKLVLEPVNISEVLADVAIIGEQLAYDKDLSWLAEIPPNLPLVLGDCTRLRQVALNLVYNAIKFTTRGQITLSAIKDNGLISVSVSDTGLGIPRHEQAAIFDEFHQSERTTARGYGGLGLGLAICKRLIDMHGGEISVYSTGEEGRGSTFSFTLPVYDYQVLAPPADLPTSHVVQVLLLTEDTSAGILLEQHLAQRGFGVRRHQVSEGNTWLARLLYDLPDVFVLDLSLASNRGWEILRALKENPATQNIPVLFYALEQEDDCGSVLEIDYLSKPIGTTALAEILAAQGLLQVGNEPTNEKTILVADDDPGILELHARIIEENLPGYQVLRAQHGREALDLIRQTRPDLVLLDLMMPEMDGFEVLEIIRQEELTRHIPVIIVTGQVLTTEDMARLNSRVASVLGKGLFNVAETLDHVTAALTHKRRPGSETQRIVLKAMAYIHTHYSGPISRRDMAAHIGLSERHLTRCFTQEVGMTPITYLNRFRVRQAIRFLEAGQNGITEIALKVGFSTSGYFTRVFREEIGVSPREYLQTRC